MNKENLVMDMTEQSMENALVELGVERESIELGKSFGSESRYIRYGYWRPLPLTFQQIAELGLEEFADWDEDCGYKYIYFY